MASVVCNTIFMNNITNENLRYWVFKDEVHSLASTQCVQCLNNARFPWKPPKPDYFDIYNVAYCARYIPFTRLIKIIVTTNLSISGTNKIIIIRDKTNVCACMCEGACVCACARAISLIQIVSHVPDRWSQWVRTSDMNLQYKTAPRHQRWICQR